MSNSEPNAIGFHGIRCMFSRLFLDQLLEFFQEIRPTGSWCASYSSSHAASGPKPDWTSRNRVIPSTDRFDVVVDTRFFCGTPVSTGIPERQLYATERSRVQGRNDFRADPRP